MDCRGYAVCGGKSTRGSPGSSNRNKHRRLMSFGGRQAPSDPRAIWPRSGAKIDERSDAADLQCPSGQAVCPRFSRIPIPIPQCYLMVLPVQLLLQPSQPLSYPQPQLPSHSYPATTTHNNVPIRARILRPSRGPPIHKLLRPPPKACSAITVPSSTALPSHTCYTIDSCPWLRARAHTKAQSCSGYSHEAAHIRPLPSRAVLTRPRRHSPQEEGARCHEQQGDLVY